MTAPRVSVIMIFHDPGRFFPEALDSVLAQTHRDLELLLVDDGSTDGSSALARATADAHPDRVRLLHHPGNVRRGMSASRNLGLAGARGELVAFLDADDVWLPDALERQLAVLDAHPDAAMVVGATCYWHAWDPDARDPDEVVHPTTPGVHAPPELAIGLLDHGISPPSTNAWVARRDAVLAVGGFVDAFEGLFEDQVFLFRFLLAHPVVVHAQVVDRYRQHPDSTCARGLASGAYDLVEASPSRLAFRKFARDHVATTPWRGTAVHRAARRAHLADRHPRLARTWRRWRPRGVRRRLARRRHRREVRQPVDLGALRRTAPVSRDYGYDRGQPVDRHYIEGFLATWRGDVHGDVLEVGEDTYTRRFGHDLAHVDVLHEDPTDPHATVVADLADAASIPDDRYDCVVVTQTLHLVADVDAAVGELHRILRPGGVALVTLPGISPMTDTDRWRHHWGLTEHSARALFARHFDDVVVEVHGNVLAATAFLYGLAADELTPAERDHRDRRFPVVVTVRARRGGQVTPRR